MTCIHNSENRRNRFNKKSLTNFSLNVRKIICRVNKSVNVDYYFHYHYYCILRVSHLLIELAAKGFELVPNL